MNGYYEMDPMTNIQKGQTVEQIVRAAKGQPMPPKKIKRPMGEDRKCFLRMMGLGKWIS